MRILLVDDERDAADLVAKGLREHGHAVDVAGDGDAALERASVNDYDLIILDVMLPGPNGFDICREIRRGGATLPILMLTARDAVDARIEGLDAGADDYLTKPFAFAELLARVRALARRQPVLRQEVLRVADLEVDTRARSVKRAGHAIELTGKEYALLEFFAQHPDTVVSRSDLAEHVWDETFDPFSNLIEVYVQRVRRKLEGHGGSRMIATRRGQGYILSGTAEASDD